MLPIRPACGLLLALLALPVQGQTVAPPDDDPITEDDRFRLAQPSQPFLHHWQATASYGAGHAPLNDDVGTRLGFGRNHQVMAGLEAGIGERGFGRIEVGRAWRDGKRDFANEVLHSDADIEILGISGGVFITSFLSAGLSLQHRREDGREIFVSKTGLDDSRTDREGSSNRVAPFLMLAGPVGPVDLALLLAYARLRSETDYSRPQLNNGNSSDSGQVNSRLADFSVGYWLSGSVKIGASLGWTEVLHQRTQSTSLPLDDDWGTLGASAVWRILPDLDLSLHADRDIENARGNGTRFGGGLAYRF
ncbi:MAG: hypothetical protein ACK4FJ_06510 [Ferrovibrio sp.]|uniref:hypothetical protein n=1 Tax=Ferrovibrio sp. TaxID=1917215 RepID=UPI003918D7AF